MSEPNSSRKDVLELELDLHKAEFLALRDEILHSIDAERQALNLSLVAAGGGISILSLVDTQSIYSILLLFPFVFHVLIWEMLNNIKSLSRISSYLTLILIPRVNKILDELGRERTDILALGWEVHTAKESLKPSQLILTSLTPTRHWLPILAVAGLLGAYSVITKGNNHIPTSTEVFLILLNLVFLIWAAIQNALTIRDYRQKAHVKSDGSPVEATETRSKSKRQAAGVKPKK
jgi:hypothetical protein